MLCLESIILYIIYKIYYLYNITCYIYYSAFTITVFSILLCEYMLVFLFFHEWACGSFPITLQLQMVTTYVHIS